MVRFEPNLYRLASKIEEAVAQIGPDLSGQKVLTEAASGPYMATSVAAAFAGAEQVYACTRDSQWGLAKDVAHSTIELANLLGVSDRINISTQPPIELATGLDLVTNLGFVRPITNRVVSKLSRSACISLMWEPWEFRHTDIDIGACSKREIAVVATNENHPHVATFRFVGLLALKLLMECNFEVADQDVVVIGSDPFGKACSDTLTDVGARVEVYNPQQCWPDESIAQAIEVADAVVVAEHSFKDEILGHNTPQLVNWISRRHLPLIHICGHVDADYLSSCGIYKYPSKVVPEGFMTLTTSHVGNKPVVDLHVAGLHVGSIVARARKLGNSIEDSINIAIASGYGLRLTND